LYNLFYEEGEKLFYATSITLRGVGTKNPLVVVVGTSWLIAILGNAYVNSWEREKTELTKKEPIIIRLRGEIKEPIITRPEEYKGLSICY